MSKQKLLKFQGWIVWSFFPHIHEYHNFFQDIITISSLLILFLYITCIIIGGFLNMRLFVMYTSNFWNILISVHSTEVIVHSDHYTNTNKSI